MADVLSAWKDPPTPPLPRYLLGSSLHIIHVCAQRSPLRGNTWPSIKSPHSWLYISSHHITSRNFCCISSLPLECKLHGAFACQRHYSLHLGQCLAPTRCSISTCQMVAFPPKFYSAESSDPSSFPFQPPTPPPSARQSRNSALLPLRS